jgi:hypothetical protein
VITITTTEPLKHILLVDWGFDDDGIVVVVVVACVPRDGIRSCARLDSTNGRALGRDPAPENGEGDQCGEQDINLNGQKRS